MFTRTRQQTGLLSRRWLVARMASLPVALLLASCGAGTVTTAPPPPATGGLATGAPTGTAAVAPSPIANTVGSTATRAAVPSPPSPTSTVGAPTTSVAPPGTPPTAAPPTPLPDTGVIRGRVTDRDGGAPLPDTRILVGYKSTQLAAITDQDGRYTVRNVPAGAEVGVMRSSLGQSGLAQIRLDALTQPLDCGGATLRPHVPVWMHLPQPTA